MSRVFQHLSMPASSFSRRRGICLLRLSTIFVAGSRFRYNMYYFRNSCAALFTVNFPELPHPDGRGEFDFDPRTWRTAERIFLFGNVSRPVALGEGNLIRFSVAELQITMNINEPRSRGTNRRNEVRKSVVRDPRASRENVRFQKLTEYLTIFRKYRRNKVKQGLAH